MVSNKFLCVKTIYVKMDFKMNKKSLQKKCSVLKLFLMQLTVL